MPIEVRAAVAYGAHQPLVIETVQIEGPGEGEVLVDLKATGLCHSDLHVLDAHLESAFPIILGHEGAGHIVECGKGVAGLKPGDAIIPYTIPHCGTCDYCRSGRTNLCAYFISRRGVKRFSLNGTMIPGFAGLGTFAQQIVVPADSVAKIRPDIPVDQASYLACGGATGIGAVLYAAKVLPESSVLVFGLGGIGMNVVQGARIAGARIIIGLDTNPKKEATARKLGATHYFNPHEIADLPQHIAALTGGGADYVFECVGNTALLRQAVLCSHWAWGKILAVGVAEQGAEISLPFMSIMTGRSLAGTMMGGTTGVTDLPKMADWLADGTVRFDDLITHHLPLERINEGFDMMKSGLSIRTVVVF